MGTKPRVNNHKRITNDFLFYKRIYRVSIDKFRCNLRWADSRTLLIGWVDTVRVCVIRKRSSIESANKDLPEFLVDPGNY